MVGDVDGVMRELIRNNLQVYPSGFYAPLLYFYDGALLGQVSSAAKAELLPRMVLVVVLDRNQHRVRDQRKMGWAFLHGTCWTLYYRRSMEQIRRSRAPKGKLVRVGLEIG